jgi:uncharacterized protein YycO
VDKINKSYKSQRRVLLLAGKGIYNLGCGKYNLNRRMDITLVNKVSVSKKADNWFILHVTGEYDYIYVCERKTEVDPLHHSHCECSCFLQFSFAMLI